MTLMRYESWLRELAWLAAAAMAGWLIIVLPALVMPWSFASQESNKAMLTGLDEAGPHTVILFAVGGAVIGMVREKRAWLSAAGMSLPLYGAALIEMTTGSVSHNLWPIEFATYGIPGGAAILASVLASRATAKKIPKGQHR